MPRSYDNWEKLVTAVVRRDQLRQLAFCHSSLSRNTSSLSSGSSDSEFSFRFMPELHQPLDADEDIDDKRFVTEERNGKICYMAGARKLLILMRRPSQYWDWTSRADSRFSEVAVLHYGRCLDIRGRIQTQKLSPNTFYAAYLVFKLMVWSKGLQYVEAVVNFFDEESDIDAQERAHAVYLQHRGTQWGSFAARRVDGWMEVEIGSFYVDEQDKAVEARVLEFNSWKVGLIVEGIEFRPLSTESPFGNRNGYQLVPVPMTDDTIPFPPLPLPSGVGSEVNQATKVAENEESEFDMSWLQELAPELDSKIQGSPPLTSTIAPPLKSDTKLKRNRLQRDNPHNDLQDISIHDSTFDPTLRFCPDWNLRNNSSLRDKGVGVEMMTKLLLPQDEPLLATFSRDELFSGGYNSLSELVYFFHGMKRAIERKDMEADDLKQKLLKSEVEAQLALAEKDSELEELRKKVRSMKVEAIKCNEKIKEVERKVEDTEARAARAVEDYKNSDEMKLDKHKFASKAFAIGFNFCVKQVLEVDPNFDMSCIDVKRLEPSSSSIVKI